MALSQVIESLHKRVDKYSKLYAALSGNQFSIPFQVEDTLDKISSLMEEIAEKEALMSKMSTKKRKVRDVVTNILGFRAEEPK
jgi:hypothetical protein